MKNSINSDIDGQISSIYNIKRIAEEELQKEGKQAYNNYQSNIMKSTSLVDLAQIGTMTTGDQLATLLQTIKEGSEVSDKVEFTPTITINTLTSFIERALSTESLKKVQFAIINIASESKIEQISNPIKQENIQSQQDQIPGEHWVSYIQIPNLFDEEGNVVGVRSIILNSARETYSSILNEIKSKIEEMFAHHNIQITLPIKNLDYQKLDLDQHQDWNTCGVWTGYFFEQVIEKIVKADNLYEIEFEEITERIDIAQKRQEYADLLKTLDASIKPITKNEINLNVDEILDIESTETDKELLDKFGINTEEIDLDELLSNADLKENTSADNSLSSVLNSVDAKELIKIIKNKANPPILDEEADLTKDQRLVTLIKAFIDLAKLYIDKADAYDADQIKQVKIEYYTEATKLLNYALSIRQDIVDKKVIPNPEENRQIYHTLESILEEINKKLINIVGGDINRAKIASSSENAILDKADLEALRTYSKTELEEIDKLADEEKTQRTRVLFEYITQIIKNYLAKVYQENEAILGPKPCDYTVIGLGSMALNQMTPYSDLEFAILTVNDEYKDDPKTKDYFTDLTHLVNFRIINLGETVIHERNISGALIYDLIHRGVNLDLGGKTPLIMEGKSELIQTVSKMLSCVKNEDNNSDYVDISAMLESTCYVHGSRDLYKIYQEGIEQFLFYETNINGVPNNQARALQRLQEGVIEKTLFSGEKGKIGNLEEFAPKLIEQNEEGKLFDAKHEIYRLPDRMLYNMAILYSIRPRSIWDVLDKLELQKIINLEAADHLRYAATFAVLLRLRTYINNKGQREDVYIFDTNKLLVDRGLNKEVQIEALSEAFCLSENDLSENGGLFKYYFVMLPLYYQLKDLCNRFKTLSDIERTNFFQTSALYNDNNANKGYIYYRLAKYQEAKKQLKKAASETNNKYSYAQVFLTLGNIYINFGEGKQAIECYSKILDIQKFKHKVIVHRDTAVTFGLLGMAYFINGEFDEAIRYYKKSLEMSKVIYKNAAHSDITSCLNNLGEVYRVKGLFDEAIKYYTASLEMKKIIYKKEVQIEIWRVLINLGNVYSCKNQLDKSLDYYEKSLSIIKLIYKSLHPALALCFNNIANVYRDKKDFDRAIEYYKNSFSILKFIYKNEFHPQIASLLDNLGGIYTEKKEFGLALEYSIRGLKIRELIYQNGIHPSVAISLNNLGEIYRYKEEFNLALECYTKSLAMQKLIYKNSEHPEIAASLNNIGLIYSNKKEFDLAIKYHTQSLEIRKLIYKNSVHLDIAGSLNNLGAVYYYKGDLEKAIKYLLQSLEIKKIIYRDVVNLDIACTLKDLGNIYYAKKILEEAIKFYAQSLEIQKFIYKNLAHLDIVVLLDNLGNIYISRGNFEEAIKYFEQSLEMKKNIYKDSMHLDIAASLTDMGMAYSKKENFDKAIEYFEQSLEIKKTIYKDSIHSDIAGSLFNLGKAFGDKGELDKAIEHQIQSLEMRRFIYKESGHIDIAASLNYLGLLFTMKGEAEKAIDLQIQSLEMRKLIYRESEHIDIVASLYGLGSAYSIKNDLSRAFTFYSQALYKAITFFPDHPYQQLIINGLIRNIVSFAERYILDLEKIGEAVMNYASQGYNFADYQLHYSQASWYYQNNQLEDTIEEYRLVLIFVPEEEKQTKISICHNLGCMYHVGAIKAKDDNNIELSDGYYQKAEESFKQALSYAQEEMNVGLYVEYANFLYQNYHYDEVSVYLVQAISNIDNTGRLSYGAMEKHTVNHHLQNEIDFYGKITINDPVAFAYYLLINVQIKLDNIEQANILVAQFKDYITSNDDSLAYSMLGYSYKNLERFTEAAAAFEQAVNLYQITEDRPEHTLAKENQALCLSMLVPLTAVEITAQEENEDVNNAGPDGSKTKAKDSTEIWRVSPVYQNPLLNDRNIQSIMQIAHRYGGIDAVNQIIDLGSNQHSYIEFTESMKSENIEKAIIKALSFNDKIYIASDLKDETIPLLINNIKNSFTEQAEFRLAESLAVKDTEFTREDIKEHTTETYSNEGQLNLHSLTIASFATKEMIEIAPTLKYFVYKILGVQYVIPQALQEIELPEFTKQNYFWVSMHYIAGMTGVLTLSAANIDITTKLMFPLASSFTYGIKLKFYDYLAEQKQSALQNQNATNYTINHPIEFVKQCGLDMFAYGALSIVSNSMSMFLFGMPLTSIGYDIAISSVMGGIQCYSTYQQQLAVNTNASKTTTELVVPYITDSLVLYMATQNIHFYNGNLASSIFGIKQGLAAISTVVITDQLTKLSLHSAHETISEFEATYVNPIWDCFYERITNVLGIIEEHTTDKQID